MKYRTLLFCVVATGVWSCTVDRQEPAESVDAANSASVPFGTPAELGLSASRLTRIDSLMHGLVERQEIAGGVALIARHGSVAYLRAFGVMDLESGRPVPTDAIFRMASMTKPVVSVAAMLLYEQGAIQLDDPVSTYIPELGAMEPQSGASQRQMTIQDLLRQTSGIPYEGQGSSIHQLYTDAQLNYAASLTEMMERLAELPLLFPPGSRWEYGYSTDVLGRVIEVVSGAPLDVFLREQIFVPLGMTDTGFFVAAEKQDRLMTLYAAGDTARLVASDAHFVGGGNWYQKPGLLLGGAGLVSTASDYWRFAQMLLNGGELDGVRILSPTTVRLMTVNHVPPSGLPISFGLPEAEWMISGTGFGLGFRVVMDPSEARIPASIGTYGWFGAYDTFFLIDPNEQLVGIFLAQFEPFPLYPGVREFQNLLFQAVVR